LPKDVDGRVRPGHDKWQSKHFVPELRESGSSE